MTDRITVPAAVPLPRMDGHERSRLRCAADQAKRVYPGPVGDLISRELLTWEDFGYRLGGRRPVADLVRHVLDRAGAR